MIYGYKYRIYPSREQAAALDEMLSDFRWLYNAALEQRIDAWDRRRTPMSYIDQARELKSVRQAFPQMARWSFSAEQQVLRRLAKAFRRFFGRENRHPRYKGAGQFNAADFRVGDGLSLKKSGRIGITGVTGEMRVVWHRPLPPGAGSATIAKRAGKWHVIFHVEAPPAEMRAKGSVGIDLGLTSLVALSNGEVVARPDWTKRAAKEMRRRQRALARCKKGSRSRAKRKGNIATLGARIAARRRDGLHKLSRSLVNRFDRIAIEDLDVDPLSRSMFAKHVHDASWAMLASMISYKAANAGGEVIKVDPRGTSQTCPGCGAVAKKALKERTHRCDCGCSLDRDVAAAMVVHFRAFGFWPGAGRGSLSEPVAA